MNTYKASSKNQSKLHETASLKFISNILGFIWVLYSYGSVLPSLNADTWRCIKTPFLAGLIIETTRKVSGYKWVL